MEKIRHLFLCVGLWSLKVNAYFFKELYVEEYATVEDIDNTWKISTGAPLGPFEIYDIIGLNTPYELEKAKPKSKEEGSTEYKMVKILEEMIDQGKLGKQSGEGFYKYDKDGNKI